MASVDTGRTPPPRLRLPLRFDANKMRADLDLVGADEWVPHFNRQEYTGGWSGVALLAPGGDATTLYPGNSDPEEYQRTEVLSRCSFLTHVLRQLRCPILSARLLKLAPGARIHEHRDYDIGPEAGRLRIHIPIRTGDAVRFVVGGRRVSMAPGEMWYLDFGLLHRVDNDGEFDRVHLVVDCVYDDWLQELIASAMSAEPPEPDASTEPSELAPLDAFRRRLIGDPGLAAQLRGASDPETFVDVAAEAARSVGSPLPTEELAEVLRVSGRGGAVLRLEEAPGEGWLPSHLDWDGATPVVHWTWLGPRDLSEPFYADTLANARREAFNRFMPVATSMEALERSVAARPGLPLVGLIAHVSRCGSTLVSQSLAGLPSLVVASEPPPFDSVLTGGPRDLDPSTRIRLVRAIAGALGQRRRGDETGFVLKLDSWHLASMPLLLEAFPDVPRVIVYRDPTAVLASHMRSPGLQMSGTVGAPFDSIPIGGLSQAEYRGRVVGMLFRHALAAADGAVLVSYPELPEAVHTRILPHFGRTLVAGDIERLQVAGARDAKSPSLTFTPDVDPGERPEWSAELRAIAERWAGQASRELERRRAAVGRVPAG